MTHGIVIAGAGLAAQRCAETLRRGGYDGRIRMVGGEQHAPYDRPPLSKAVLAGREAEDDLGLRPGGWHAERGVELLLGVPAAGLDCARRVLTLADGRALSYEQLLIATGSRPRRLALLDRRRRGSARRSRSSSPTPTAGAGATPRRLVRQRTAAAGAARRKARSMKRPLPGSAMTSPSR
jgi:NADPH-dependent 2,4-dienoyl-CoA reductase/sulfur reductase-like enzyme